MSDAPIDTSFAPSTNAVLPPAITTAMPANRALARIGSRTLKVLSEGAPASAKPSLPVQFDEDEGEAPQAAPAPRRAPTAPPQGKMTLAQLAEAHGVKLAQQEPSAPATGASARDVMEALEGGEGWSPNEIAARQSVSLDHHPAPTASGASLAARIFAGKKPHT